uniref:Uncharacterized protein n=1 Tax=Astyanax mexicanus TaxID=7994 RepID=A0A3B1ILQ4_ASTMX
MADGEEPMAVDVGSTGDWDGRWSHVQKFLERSGPFTHPDFEASEETLQFLLDTCKILVIGAGGLGCELLKNLFGWNSLASNIYSLFSFLTPYYPSHYTFSLTVLLF